MKPAPKNISPRAQQREIWGKNSPDALIIDQLERLLATTVDKARGNTSGFIVDSFIKPRAYTMFGHPVYSLNGTGPSFAVSGPHV